MLSGKLTRREFLQGTGILIVSFSLPISRQAASAQAATASKTVALDEVDAYLAIDPTGRVTLYSGKVELGTGVSTGLRQIVAEELDVPLARISLIEGDTLLTPAQGKTWAASPSRTGACKFARLRLRRGKRCCKKRPRIWECLPAVSSFLKV